MVVEAQEKHGSFEADSAQITGMFLHFQRMVCLHLKRQAYNKNPEKPRCVPAKTCPELENTFHTFFLPQPFCCR